LPVASKTNTFNYFTLKWIGTLFFHKSDVKVAEILTNITIFNTLNGMEEYTYNVLITDFDELKNTFFKIKFGTRYGIVGPPR
jgi:hypothetical protein